MQELIDLINSIESSEVIFFGGSFNPLHDGHIACLKLLNSKHNTIVIPDFNPQKMIHAIENDKEFIHNLKEKVVPYSRAVYTGFFLQKQKNPTYIWLNELKDRITSKKLSLLLGSDSLINFNTWVEAEKLSKILHAIYVVPRMDSNEVIANKIKYFLEINPKIMIYILPQHEYKNLASSQLRKN